MFIYSLYDRKMREFGPLMLGKNEDEVKRGMFQLHGTDSIPGKYPGDFDLMLVGEFNKETGEIGRYSPSLVVNLADLFTLTDVLPLRSKEA